MNYHPNIRDKLRRAYYLKGPFQPVTHKFPCRNFGKGTRRFNPAWFSAYSNWLEYSIGKDAAFCLCCFLFKPDIGEQSGGDSFVGEGFSNWKKSERLKIHVGGPNILHNQAWRSCEALMNQNQHIPTIFYKQTDQARIEYRTRLTASIECIRYLLHQRLAFRGHDESEDSNNQGNFLTLLRFHADHNKDVKAVVLENAPANLKLTLHEIQKEIINSISTEIINFIIRDAFFSILIDESRDVSIKEQMAIVLRYVKNGSIIEHFIGMVHVRDATALSLKAAIDNLALVAVAKNHSQIFTFFLFVTNVVNVVEASCKRRDMLREKQIVKVIERLNNGELSSGQGLNQSTSLIRPGDTRWGSHYVLEMTNELSKALQRKDQDIVNAMSLVKVCKQRLQMTREDGWDSLLEEVSSFCERYGIDVPNMDDKFFAQGRRRRKMEEMTNLRYYRVELFYSVIDMQLQELNSRFSEASSELLLCMSCLCPDDSFLTFDKQKIIRFAEYYPKEFSTVKLRELDSQLANYIIDVRSTSSFEGLKGISTLAKKMVKAKKDKVYPLVY
ncbi:uncharacterized protein LOC132277914 [Cornus florida]|uniref:uncharacterized protein LOC132277914 n=1 Tax=Cornus florida TaxID=4283 RepID=UPI002898F9E2|nr:uncharacterized protein LOC132277914 [Cornus florida]